MRIEEFGQILQSIDPRLDDRDDEDVEMERRGRDYLELSSTPSLQSDRSDGGTSQTNDRL